MKVRKGGGEEIPLFQGKDHWLGFAGAAVKRYPMPRVRVWDPLTGRAWVLPDLGQSLGFWRSLGPSLQLLQWLPLSLCLVSVQDEMLVASVTRGECVTQKDSSPPPDCL